ncbi:unnamed protein product, partial [Mesorhabditis belari]|uniref:Kynurenine 3-monooxygenase n=1 Tax=Mesorhabditis belari TaxID=2138241 RepID=A0AAF3F7X4_9BILA
MPKVLIAGAGLVGALNACYFAQKGWDVEVYEFRPDIRKMEHVPGRSINLALSDRGKAALEGVGLKEYIVQQGVPLYGRLVHDKDGKTFHRIPYGQPGQHIVSINRRHLNEVMITLAEKSPNVRFFFEHKVKSVNVEKQELTVICDGIELTQKAELILGCDGAYSAVRRSLAAYPRFDFAQEYIEHGYVELNILPKNKDFALEPNAFHLWPRGDYTMIALANRDHTFTVTIFAPFRVFEEQMSNDSDIIKFFEENFHDALELMGRAHVLETFHRVRPQSLVSIKCKPHHFGKSVLLTGDAAHAMVPFYGQGMNCGFEDCLVLSEIIDQHANDIPKALRVYSETRVKDAHNIIDLAMYNYEELKDLVNHTSYKLRKKLDLILNRWLPETWIPLYSMVTFTRIPYSQVVQNRKWQDDLLRRVHTSLFLGFLAAGSAIGYLLVKKRNLL